MSRAVKLCSSAHAHLMNSSSPIHEMHSATTFILREQHRIPGWLATLLELTSSSAPVHDVHLCMVATLQMRIAPELLTASIQIKHNISRST